MIEFKHISISGCDSCFLNYKKEWYCEKILVSLVTVLSLVFVFGLCNSASADTLSTDSQMKITQIEGNGYCKPVYYAANGYSCRYKNGQWDYIVTKGNLEATLGVMSNGWVSSLGGGYFNRPK